jgi:hypothetical protein
MLRKIGRGTAIESAGKKNAKWVSRKGAEAQSNSSASVADRKTANGERFAFSNDYMHLIP